MRGGRSVWRQRSSGDKRGRGSGSCPRRHEEAVASGAGKDGKAGGLALTWGCGGRAGQWCMRRCGSMLCGGGCGFGKRLRSGLLKLVGPK
jgi:hypothetical protein